MLEDAWAVKRVETSGDELRSVETCETCGDVSGTGWKVPGRVETSWDNLRDKRGNGRRQVETSVKGWRRGETQKNQKTRVGAKVLVNGKSAAVTIRRER